jgi:hypothetical protein
MRFDQILVWFSGAALAGYLAHVFPVAACIVVFAGWFLFASGKAFLLEPLFRVAAQIAAFVLSPLRLLAVRLGLA